MTNKRVVPISDFRLEVVAFGGTVAIPMPYPADVTRDDIINAGRSYLNEGKVREAVVINTITDEVVWSASWTLAVNENGAQA